MLKRLRKRENLLPPGYQWERNSSIPEKEQTVQHDRTWASYSMHGHTQEARGGHPLEDQEEPFLLDPLHQLSCKPNDVYIMLII